MEICPEAVALIRKEETFQAEAYLCPAGVWTIGYGDTGPHVRRGMRITEAEAYDRLLERLADFGAGVEAALQGAHVSPKQFGALVSLAYNIGLEGLRKSRLLAHVRAGNAQAAADEFLKWTRARDRRTGELRELRGLVRRRALERALFLGDDPGRVEVGFGAPSPEPRDFEPIAPPERVE